MLYARYGDMQWRVLVVVLCVVLPIQMYGQYDANMSHYFDLESSYNAAAVGKESKVNVNVAYNMSLVGFENNPKTLYASADTPFYFLKMYHGVGATFVSDNIGVFAHQRITIAYSAKARIFGGQLGIGVKAGLIMETLKGDKVDLEDSSDPAFATSSQTGNGFDLGVGLYYTHKYFYVGASAEHLTSPTVSLGETNELKIDATYYFTAGGNIPLRSTFLKIKPSVLFRSDLTTWRADLTARLVYSHEKRMMYIGLGYSPLNSVSLFVGGNFHGVVIGYCYEYYTSGLSITNGGHELVLGYQIDVNLIKKGRNRHQSVRIL